MNVVIAGVSMELPPQVVTTDELEARLAPLYQRIGLVPGRLELMTGIKERRFWNTPIKPSEIAARAGKKALAKAGIDRSRIGALVHGSVCRDFLEPATASVVHHLLELPRDAMAFDVSNACLGVLTGVSVLQALIESGRIEAGLVVSGEDGRPLVDQTVAELLADQSATRNSIKGAFASLTIGSGGAAIVVARQDVLPQGHRIMTQVQQTASEHHVLCQGGAQGTMAMATDAESLLHAGLDLAERGWKVLGPRIGPPSRVITHQVGRAHTRLLHERLGLDESLGYVTYDRLGNVGSASLPITLAMAEDAGLMKKGDTVALMGIGSGLQSLMMGIEW